MSGEVSSCWREEVPKQILLIGECIHYLVSPLRLDFLESLEKLSGWLVANNVYGWQIWTIVIFFFKKGKKVMSVSQRRQIFFKADQSPKIPTANCASEPLTGYCGKLFINCWVLLLLDPSLQTISRRQLKMNYNFLLLQWWNPLAILYMAWNGSVHYSLHYKHA